MGSFHIRLRVLSFVLSLLILTAFVAPVGAQGLFGVGLPGLSSSGGFLGGSYTCGEKPFPRVGAPVFYVGWMEGPRGTSFGADTDGLGLGGLRKLTQRYDNRGVWFGLSDTVTLTDRLGFVASGWYLVPSNTVSQQVFNDGDGSYPLFGRSWNTNSQWWFVDGLFAFGPCCGPATLLVGLRYDYFTTRFQDPPFANIEQPPAQPNGGVIPDEADVTSQGWIPLIGVQVAYEGAASKLAVRAVGFPTTLGSVKYSETILVTNRVEATGTYNGGSFLEVFAEYSRKFGGADVGVFGRWNNLQGRSDLSVDLLPAGGSQTFKLGLSRSSWTLGGSFALSFNTPF